MDLTKEAVHAIERICQDAAGAKVLFLGETPFGVSKPQNVTLQSLKPLLDEYATAPDRRKGTARLLDVDSFADHVNRFKDADSVLFGDPGQLPIVNQGVRGPSLTCVFDYNPGGADNKAARFGQHRAVYLFPLSEEWAAWTSKSGVAMDQAAFAAFLEDRIVDVSDAAPETLGETVRAFAQKLGVDVKFASAARLLQLASELEVHVNEKVRTAVKLGSGETSVQYEAEHVDKQGQPLRIPGAFVLALPVFKNGPRYQVAARLRYRVQQGTIAWWFSLHRVDLILDHATNEAFVRAHKQTELPLFQGFPEGS